MDYNLIKIYYIAEDKTEPAYYTVKPYQLIFDNGFWELWGEFQEIREVEDGYFLDFEATQYKPILRWVLGWGSDVEPLEPQKLVDEWKAEILKCAEKIKNEK